MSLRRAIDQKCKSCLYDELALGSWRAQIAACSSPDCPLYGVRPLPASGIHEHGREGPKNAKKSSTSSESTLTTQKADMGTPCSEKQPKWPQNEGKKLEGM